MLSPIMHTLQSTQTDDERKGISHPAKLPSSKITDCPKDPKLSCILQRGAQPSSCLLFEVKIVLEPQLCHLLLEAALLRAGMTEAIWLAEPKILLSDPLRESLPLL